jgi:hypothetical protein
MHFQRKIFVFSFSSFVEIKKVRFFINLFKSQMFKVCAQRLLFKCSENKVLKAIKMG